MKNVKILQIKDTQSLTATQLLAIKGGNGDPTPPPPPISPNEIVIDDIIIH